MTVYVFVLRNQRLVHGDVCGPPRADIHSRPGQDWAHLQPAHAAVEFCLWLCCESINNQNVPAVVE